MKKIFTCLTILILFLVIVFGLGIFGYSYYTKQISAESVNNKPQIITIAEGESISEVADALTSQNIISNPTFFTLYLKLHHIDKDINAGVYSIPTHASIISIVAIMQQGDATTTITIPEGLRLEEEAEIIDTKLSQNNPTKQFDKNQFITLAKSAQAINDQNRAFLPKGTVSLEGFLFPDTYSVNKTITSSQMITLMLDTFNIKVYEKYKNPTNGLSFYQNLVLASLLEREAKTDNDKRMISDILMRRLQNGTPLGIDSTIQYMLGYSPSEQTWWRQTITEADLQIDSPYNTRLNQGLPPTPICNPGEASMSDANSPISNTYYYYLSDKSGVIHYAHTSDGQSINIGKYLY